MEEIPDDCDYKCNICGITGTLESSIKKFNEVYQKKIEIAGCGPSELKIKILEDWVANLTEQTAVLVETVGTLEKEGIYWMQLAKCSQMCTELEVEGDNSCARLFSGLQKDIDGVRKTAATTLHNSGLEFEKKLSKANEEIENLKKQVNESKIMFKKLNEEIAANEKSAREMRAALTAEVADKHDQVLALRRDVQHLEEKLRQADMQTHFKDDIIKELRKEVKVANTKLKEKEQTVGFFDEKSSQDSGGKTNECVGCSTIAKVMVPQLFSLKKGVHTGLCNLKNMSRYTSSKTSVQRQCEFEELLNEINKSLTLMIDCASVMTGSYPSYSKEQCASDQCSSFSEIYRGKGDDHQTDGKPNIREPRMEIASLESQIACLNDQIAELHCELQEKESYIRSLKKPQSFVKLPLMIDCATFTDSELLTTEKNEKEILHQSVIQQLENKVKSLENQLKHSQECCINNINKSSSSANTSLNMTNCNDKLVNKKVNLSSSKGWAPWSSKQTPIRRHVYDV